MTRFLLRYPCSPWWWLSWRWCSGGPAEAGEGVPAVGAEPQQQGGERGAQRPADGGGRLPGPSRHSSSAQCSCRSAAKLRCAYSDSNHCVGNETDRIPFIVYPYTRLEFSLGLCNNFRGH